MINRLEESTSYTYSFKGDGIKLIDKSIYIVALILYLVTPLVVRFHMVNLLSPTIDRFGIGTNMVPEMHAFYKFCITIVLATIMGMGLLYKIFFLNYRVVKSKLNYIISALFILLPTATLFSEFKSISLFGYYDRYEGSLTHLAYLTIFFVLMNIKISRQEIKLFFLCQLPLVIINIFLALLKMFEINILKFNPISRFLGFGSNYKYEVGRYLTSTIGNENNMSGMTTILFALFLAMFLFSEEKKWKFFSLIMTYLSFILICLSNSSSGIIVSFASLFGLVIYWSIIQIKKRRHTIVHPTLFIFGILFIFFVFMKINPALKENVPVINLSKLTSKSIEADVKISNYTGNKWAMIEKTGNDVPSLPEQNVSALSGRTYIWEKSIQLSKEKIWFGYGFDTLAYTFNQHDIEMISHLGTYDLYVGNPHSVYINWLYGAGVFVLMLYMAVYGLLIKKWIVSNKGKHVDIIVFALGMSLLTYLIQGIVNDSVIGISIMHWAQLGLLANLLYRRTDMKREE